MRLLNAKTLELKEFFGGSIPEYTILSHTWGEEEVTLQEIVERRWWKKRGIKKKAGFKKITGCQRLTRELGLDWFWIDTCCIDKTSSAELSEAVNSMYQWYQRSRKCFAFLSDVSWEDGPVSKNSSFRRSRWFTRGWTLQELLAPTFLEFYDQAWVSLGFRDSQRLTGIIKEITGIGGEILGASFKDQPAATIFSWASRRKTSRQEDMTYCLLGLLNITMPLLYGEGNRAFARLQEERLKQRHDQTLLAWGLDDKL
ncbi:heterokaryon incompatibility protein-domain-containing protein, partial [Truncatella angustata]